MKTIVILSTEPWGKMLLSKMHYAIELAAMGNKVFFVNPPRQSDQSDIIEKGAIHSGVQLLFMKPLKYALMLRHKFLPIYNWRMKSYAKKIKELAGGHIDELWNFNPNSFPEISGFGAAKNILLIFDFYKGKHVELAAKHADMVLTPSQLILDYYQPFFKRGYFLQHGLGSDFVAVSKERLKSLETPPHSKPVKVGYTGNLLRQAMNTGIMQRIISENPGIEFHIWGPYSQNENNVTDKNLSVSEERAAFINFLKQASNVMLHGVKEPAELAKELIRMDAFLFVYSAGNDMNAASNSHKLLEYISTGKTVISSVVSTYKYSGLIEMCEDERLLPEFFSEVIKNIADYNTIEKQKERISYALSNSYVAQIDKIHKYLYQS